MNNGDREARARAAVLDCLASLAPYLTSIAQPRVVAKYAAGQWNPAAKHYDQILLRDGLTPMEIRELLRAADTDPAAYDVCLKIAETYNELTKFLHEIATGKRKRPTKRGRKIETNFGRDLVIRDAVEIAAQCGLPKSSSGGRSRRRRLSACEIVADCLESHGVFLTSGDIDEIRKGNPTRKRNARKRASN